MANSDFTSVMFRTCFSVYFQALTMKKLTRKYYNKQITTRDNVNVQSHVQEENKLNSTINANSEWSSHAYI